MKVGAPVSLSGRYAVQGRAVQEGLSAWASENASELFLTDDESSPDQAVRSYERLVRTCDIVIGPYGSDLTRAVAMRCPGTAIWNHGAAADDVQRLPGVVSVPSPASRYLVALARAVTTMRPEARICVLTAPGRFAASARHGLEAAASRLRLDLNGDPAAADALLLCGPISWEINHLRRPSHQRLLLGAVSPGLASFPQLLDCDPEGMLAPVQWHPDLPSRAKLGPHAVDLDDYIAAQAYAAALIADHCHQTTPDNPLDTARHLRTTTFFGEFALADDGLQTAHKLAVVQWRNGRRELVRLADTT